MLPTCVYGMRSMIMIREPEGSMYIYLSTDGRRAAKRSFVGVIRKYEDTTYFN